MARTLAIPHLACQEGALHGLGHWQRAYPDRVAAIVDGARGRGTHAPPADPAPPTAGAGN